MQNSFWALCTKPFAAERLKRASHEHLDTYTNVKPWKDLLLCLSGLRKSIWYNRTLVHVGNHEIYRIWWQMAKLDQMHLWIRYLVGGVELCPRSSVSLSLRCTSWRPSLLPLFSVPWTYCNRPSMMRTVASWWNYHYLLGGDEIPSGAVRRQHNFGDAILPITSENYQETIDRLSWLNWSQINFHKSMIVPFNVEKSLVTHLAHFWPCSIVAMPFTHLGLPRGPPSLLWYISCPWKQRNLYEPLTTSIYDLSHMHTKVSTQADWASR